MKIKVGEYVRTEFGNIGKFYRPASESPDIYYIYIDKDGNKISSRYDSIVKHSKNIIDLIEVGDIVHTRDVLNEDYCYMYDESFIRAIKEDIANGIELIDILTHEQFEQNAYRLEENNG